MVELDDADVEERFYLVSFNSTIDSSNPLDIKAVTALEHFVYIGTLTQHFDELMGGPELPVDAGQILNRIELVRRFNPQRHIRLYGVKTVIDDETFRKFCENDPVVAEMAIRETGIVL